MKKFIRHIILFSLLAIAFVEATCAFLIYTEVYLFNYPGKYIYEAIKKSKVKSKAKTLILGDSVGRQFFPVNSSSDSINSLATNQAIGLIGQYLLLNNYLKAGNQIDEVILLYTPFSFKDNLDQEFTYHYFLKPFDNEQNSPYYSATVREQIAKIPYHQFHQLPHIKATSWAPKFELDSSPNNTFLSPIAIDYLSRIKTLANQHNCQLKLISPPINIAKRELLKQLDLSTISETNLETKFQKYFATITYVDSTLFVDGIHLKDPERMMSQFKQKVLN
ncbi:hypothetical protein [Carboxylicivirga sp. N1Y90]|uniref:hypothetical protein n=1 Tax=Carboxylicivirga fragile TaxID=3417571 RepID=UPI003D32F1B5|nr:hypothetical protein [Marinilabiliaceae bacterium N1Y90]